MTLGGITAVVMIAIVALLFVNPYILLAIFFPLVLALAIVWEVIFRFWWVFLIIFFLRIILKSGGSQK